MSMSFANYASLKDKLIYPQLFDTVQTSNQTLAVWDLSTTDAPYVQVNRLYAYPTVQAVDCSSTITASDISGGPVTFSFDSYETSVPVCWDSKVGANAGGTMEQGIMLALLRAASEKMESLIIDGGTNFNGLDDLVTQSFAAGSTASTADLSKALRLTKGQGRKVFIAGGAAYDKIESVLKDEATLSYQDLANGTFNTIAYRGVPVVINENMTDGDVFCATLGGDGVRVVFNEDSGRKIGGIFDLVNIPMGLSSINEYVRVLFRATQVLGSTQALTKISSFD